LVQYGPGGIRESGARCLGFYPSAGISSCRSLHASPKKANHPKSAGECRSEPKILNSYRASECERTQQIFFYFCLCEDQSEYGCDFVALDSCHFDVVEALSFEFISLSHFARVIPLPSLRVHALAQVYQSLVESVDSNQTQARVLDIQDDIHSGRHDLAIAQRRMNRLDGIAGLLQARLPGGAAPGPFIAEPQHVGRTCSSAASGARLWIVI
jgi:hypothetical protein